MATYPWIEAAWEPFTSMSEGKAEELAALRAWMDRLAARPAVARGMAVGSGN
jgi:glutathione S-transferase